MSSVYKCLPAPPIANGFKNLVMINEYEFIAVTSKGWGNDDTHHGIYKYNTKTNTWILLMAYPSDCAAIAHKFCYDSINNIIYMAGIDERLYIFNLDNKTMNIIKKLDYLGCNPSLLMINGQCHIILGSRSKAHYTYNADLKKFEKIFEFTEFTAGLHENGIIYIKSKSILLLFGGYDPVPDRQFDVFWEFDLSAYKRTKRDDIKLPVKMSSFGWILSKNEDYLVIFGGFSREKERRIKNIFILDLKVNVFYSSTIRLNIKTYYNAVLVHDQQSSDALINGYVRTASNDFNINIPSELIHLFRMYFVSETVHLISYSGHYSIKLEDILREKSKEFDVEYFNVDSDSDSD